MIPAPCGGKALASQWHPGDGVPQNYVEAYVWFSIAAANGQANAKQVLPRLKAKLTPDQFAAAQKRATQIFKQINANKE